MIGAESKEEYHGGEEPADAGPNRHPGDLIKMKVLIQQVWVAPEIPQC